MGTDRGYIENLCQKTSEAAGSFYSSPLKVRNDFLHTLNKELILHQNSILKANQIDLEKAEEMGLSSALIDRLTLDHSRIETMATGVKKIANLPDPLGEIIGGKILENGITLYEQRVPLGVVLIIYESRPNVTVDIASLTIKSGNGVILRGGKESLNTNLALGKIIKNALRKNELNENLVNLVEKTERELVLELLKQNEFIDIVVPRGGSELIKMVNAHSSIPVIKHDKGLCHIFVDKDSNMKEVIPIVINAKIQRPGVCNAVETLLIHKNLSYKKELLSALAKAGVNLRLDEELHKQFPQYSKATKKDWEEEYLDLILSVKMTSSTQEATSWINHYGSKHSEAILSNQIKEINYFKKNVDSACLLINCSTRFHDGSMFGLGAEVGISTQKLHVRGPMALKHLTCLKYIVEGNGQIRE